LKKNVSKKNLKNISNLNSSRDLRRRNRRG
jgi:hypothetical protein